MARLPRLIVDGLPHLLSQRVQHEQTLARDAADLQALLERLRHVAAENVVAVHAYALLDDRFDVVVTPQRAAGLSRFMQSVARRHSSDFNRRHGRSGSLWAGRYRVAVLDPESWLLTCMSFVEQQLHKCRPQAGTPDEAKPGALSSEAHHSGARAEPWLIDPAVYWALGNTPFEREERYRALMLRPLPEATAVQIEAALRGGWPLGSEEFINRISVFAARPVLPRMPGRPSLSRG